MTLESWIERSKPMTTECLPKCSRWQYGGGTGREVQPEAMGHMASYIQARAMSLFSCRTSLKDTHDSFASLSS